MPEYSQQEIEAILKRFKFVATRHINSEGLKNYLFEAVQDFDTDDIVLRLFYRPFGEIITEIKYPANWKEAIKEALYNWINKLYKKWYCERSKRPLSYLVLIDTYRAVKYKRYDVAVYYPRITLPNEERVTTFKSKEATHE